MILFSALCTCIAAEMLFYIFCFTKVNQLNALSVPPKFDRYERERCFTRILSYISTKNQKDFLTQWFHGCKFESIHRDNVLEWLAWALMTRKIEDVPSQKELDELNSYVDQMEAQFREPFPAGKNDQLQCARLNIDDIAYIHRPCLLYLFMASLDLFSRFCFFLTGFQRRFVVLDSNNDQKLYYYHRSYPKSRSLLSSSPSVAPSSAKKLPLLFIHGIGIGLFPYQVFIQFLAYSLNRELIILELPFISQKLFSYNSISTREKYVKAIETILHTHNHKKVLAVGHSYGSVVVSWLLRLLPHRVSSVSFIDPVTFLLFLPNVCINFVYARPRMFDLRAWVIHYFAKREMNTAITLSRHFYWYQNDLWIEDLDDSMKVMVCLAGQDMIVPSGAVKQYLSQHACSSTESRLQLLYMEDFHHAGFIFNLSAIKTIVRGLRAHV